MTLGLIATLVVVSIWWALYRLEVLLKRQVQTLGRIEELLRQKQTA